MGRDRLLGLLFGGGHDCLRQFLVFRFVLRGMGWLAWLAVCVCACVWLLTDLHLSTRTAAPGDLARIFLRRPRRQQQLLLLSSLLRPWTRRMLMATEARPIRARGLGICGWCFAPRSWMRRNPLRRVLCPEVLARKRWDSLRFGESRRGRMESKAHAWVSWELLEESAVWFVRR